MIKTIALSLALFTVGAALYAPTLNHAFIADDLQTIAANPLLAKGSLGRPNLLLNSLAWRLSGHSPFSFRLLSVLLHALAAVLVFIFLGLFFSARTSFLAALLFVLHPASSEAVNLVSDRPYILNVLFILAAYCAYHKADKRGRHWAGWYCLALALFGYYSIESYTFFLLLPFFLFLADLAFRRLRRNWPLLLPFFAVAAVRLALVTGQVAERISYMTLAPRIWDLSYFVYSFYQHLWLFLWPQQLILLRDSIQIPSAVFRLQAVFALPVFLALYLAYRKMPLFFLGLGMFLLFLAPTFSPVPIASLVAERYLYCSGIGLLVCLSVIYEGSLRRWPGLRTSLSLGLLLIALAAGLRTIARNSDWGSPEVFWKKTCLAYPRSWQAPSNLGFIYLQQGRLLDAIAEYEKAVRLNPGSADLFNNLGVAYQRAGEPEKATSAFRRAAEINPQYHTAYYNLGRLYLARGMATQALEAFLEAVRTDPGDAEAHLELSLLYYRQKKPDLAIRHCDEAARLGKAIPTDYLNTLSPWRRKSNP